MPSLHLWADANACQNPVGAKFQENQKPGKHPAVISYKAEDSAAITQAKQLQLGSHFLVCASVIEGQQLVRNEQ